MWTKLWETVDGHDTGRWQWFTDQDVNAHVKRNVAVPARISGDRVGCVYPGVWMFGDAICAPPGMGLCLTDKKKAEKDQALMSMR